MEIGQKIRKIRELKGYSQECMAINLNVTQITYSRIETGQTKLDLRRLEKISEILEMDILQILSFDEKFLFKKCEQSGMKSSTNNMQKAERDLYKTQIQHLETEIIFLREIIKTAKK